MKRFLFVLLSICQVVFMSSAVFAKASINTEVISNSKGEALFDMKISSKYSSILDDRIFIKMPEGTEDLPIQESIMGVAASNQEETRLIVEAPNGQMLVVYAQEMLMYSTGDLKEDAKSLWEEMTGQEKGDYELSEIKSNKDLNVVKVDIKNIDIESDAFLINSAFVRTSENALIFVSVYANANSFKSKEECLKFSASLLSTIKTGDRKLNVSEHKDTISNMNIDVKKDYVVTSQKGQDFDVYYIKKMVPIDEFSPYMGIYLGNNPSFSEELQEYEIEDIKKSEAKILGNKVEWLYYGKASEKINENSYMQTLVDTTKKDSYAKYIHIFIYPTNQENLTEMKEMAESLKYIK